MSVDAATAITADSNRGDQIGPYRLLEKVGEGGFGEVWLAEQKEPVKRRVAVKIIKLGMDTRQVVARFEAERQALAMMDHPNIAKVLDAGATELGRPFFVMELVRGVPITEYCNTNSIGTTERLNLFIQVCRAIQHAHQKGIIHRDIKPSNILVTMQDAVAVPKVIDFGIAKATQVELTEKTVYTQLNQFIGTPAYMSPEQAEMTGIDIDTRSDIYSLGVLLYELLTNSTPFDTKELISSGLDQMRRIIREREPVRPSTRLKSLVAADGKRLTRLSDNQDTAGQSVRTSSRRLPPTTLASLHSLLSTDLDWIVMKCLEKDRTRRYETANGLALDIQRHLNHEPVIARPPSAAYRFRKMALRNRAAFAASALVLLALISAVLVSSSSAVRARRAEQKERNLRASAERAQRTAEEASLLARRNLYAADMLLAYQAEANGNLGQVRRLLKKYVPTDGLDLRGWEWWSLAARGAGDHGLVLRGHTNEVPDVHFLPGQNQVVSLGSQGTLRFWNSETGAELERRPIAGGKLSFAVSSDGRFIAVPGEKLFVWDNGVLRIFEDAVTDYKTSGACFSPNGEWFGVADSQFVRVYSVPDFKLYKAIPRSGPYHGSFRLGLAFTPDSSAVGYGHNDRRLILHRLADGLERTVGSVVTMEALTLAISPDGKYLVAGDHRGIYVCSITEGRVLRTLTGHSEQITRVCFSPDGSRLASASGDQTVRLWDTTTWEIVRVIKGHEHEVHGADFSSDGQFLVTCGKDDTVRVWNLNELQSSEQRVVTDLSTSFKQTLSNPEKLIIAKTNDQLVAFDLRSFREEVFQPFALKPVAFAAAGQIEEFAIALAGGTLELWNNNPRKRIRTLKAPRPVRYLALSERGQFLAAVRDDDTLDLWDARAGRIIHSLTSAPAGPNILWNVLFGAEDSLLIRISRAQTGYDNIEVLDINSRRYRSVPSTHKGFITHFAVSPDGRTLATTAWDGTVKLWDTGTVAETGTLLGQLIGFTSVAYTQDGTRLAAGAWDGSITLWNTTSRQQVGKWKAHPQMCWWLKFMDRDESLLSIGVVYLHTGVPEIRRWQAKKIVPEL